MTMANTVNDNDMDNDRLSFTESDFNTGIAKATETSMTDTTEVDVYDVEDRLAKSFGGYWASHPEYTVYDWQCSIGDGFTRQSYWQWVAQCIEEEDAEEEV
jgi:hypothetical protein